MVGGPHARQNRQNCGSPKRKKPPDFHPAASLSVLAVLSGELQIHSLRAAAILLNIESHLRAFFKRRQAGALDCGNVNENVLAARFRRDEPETTGRIEKFNGAGLAHRDIPFPYVGRKDGTGLQILSSKVGKGSFAKIARTDDPAAVLTECPRMGRSNISTHQHFAFGPDLQETQVP